MNEYLDYYQTQLSNRSESAVNPLHTMDSPFGHDHLDVLELADDFDYHASEPLDVPQIRIS